MNDPHSFVFDSICGATGCADTLFLLMSLLLLAMPLLFAWCNIWIHVIHSGINDSLTPSIGHALSQTLFCELVHTKHDCNLGHNPHVVDWQSTVQAFPDTILHVHSDKSIDAATVR